jgi:hypothetical protein
LSDTELAVADFPFCNKTAILPELDMIQRLQDSNSGADQVAAVSLST